MIDSKMIVEAAREFLVGEYARTRSAINSSFEKDVFTAGAKWAEKHIMEQAASGFEEYYAGYENDLDRHPTAKDVWQAARLSLIKEAANISVSEKNQHLLNQASLAAIEKLQKEIESLKQRLSVAREALEFYDNAIRKNLTIDLNLLDTTAERALAKISAESDK